LSIIEEFQADTKEFQRDNVLEIKLLQRRSKCWEVQEQFEQAKEDLDKAMLLDPQNPIVRASVKRVQERLNTVKFDEYRSKGNDFLKQKKFPDAMEFYDKCLRITRKATTLDNVAIYVNKIACLLSLEKYN
jgi:tetratricopeptide (TPR) repeat protein